MNLVPFLNSLFRENCIGRVVMGSICFQVVRVLMESTFSLVYPNILWPISNIINRWCTLCYILGTPPQKTEEDNKKTWHEEKKRKYTSELTWEFFQSTDSWISQCLSSIAPVFLFSFLVTYFSLKLSKTLKIPHTWTVLLILSNFYIFFFFFFFTARVYFALPSAFTSSLLPIHSSIFCLEKVPSQPPPWRGGGVLGHVSMHIALSTWRSRPFPLLQDAASPSHFFKMPPTFPRRYENSVLKITKKN